MSARDRHSIRGELAGFLASEGTRARAVILEGRAGIGKTLELDLLHAELLARGCEHVLAIDDAELVSDVQLRLLHDNLVADPRARVVVTSTESATPLAAMLDRTCSVRTIELPELTVDEARVLLEGVGVPAWTWRSQRMLATMPAVPRDLIDHALSAAPFLIDVVEDTSYDGALWTTGAALRFELAARHETDRLARVVAQVQRAVAGDDPSSLPDGMDLQDGLAFLAYDALYRGAIEDAVQLSERAANDTDDDAVRIYASMIGAAARAGRGEPTAMLSLHALAGAASRAGLAKLESMIWYQIGVRATHRGDVSLGQRAAIRSIQMADDVDAVAFSTRARLMLAELHVCRNEMSTALALLEDLELLADSIQLPQVVMHARGTRARALVALGQYAEAAALSDSVLEYVVDNDDSSWAIVDARVISARAHAATESSALALEVLGSTEHAQAGVAEDGPEFWIALEAIRILSRSAEHPLQLQSWHEVLAAFTKDVHGGALRAAHAEADAWRAAVEGRRAEAARLAERARQLWIEAECHDELPLTEVLIQQAPLEQGPRLSIIGTSSPAEAAPAPDPEAFEALTKREREIARYVAGGLTNPEIAGELHLSPRTVEHHVASILRKLELPSRRALVRGQV